jgi:transcriptional regulator with XRE-family HTH domain
VRDTCQRTAAKIGPLYEIKDHYTNKGIISQNITAFLQVRRPNINKFVDKSNTRLHICFRMMDLQNPMVGASLKACRDEAGLQQKDLADRTGIQMSRISRIENGHVQPIKEEVMALLNAIGTDQSLRLVHDIDEPLRHVNAPTWLELSGEDKQALRHADKAIAILNQFCSHKNFPKIMEGHVEFLRERLLTSAAYLVNIDHTINLIGPIGVGKTTATNSVFNLTAEFKASRRKGSFKTIQGLLPTGPGRTTAFEYRLAFGSETMIRVERLPEADLLREVRNVCEYYFERARASEGLIRPMSEEEEKVLRNMADLSEDREGNDRLALLAQSTSTLDDLFFQFRQQLNLPNRSRTELSYARDNEEGLTEGEWIRKRCRQLNYGLLSDFPLPQNITIFLPNPALKGEHVHFTVNDTRGLSEGPIRRDITAALDDNRAVNVLCTRFFDAPTEKILQVIELARTLGGVDSNAISGKRLAMLVLPQHDEALKLPLADGELPSDRTQGYEIRRRQVKKVLGTDADHIDVLFFDAESDSADDLRLELLSKIANLRRMARNDIERWSEDVDDLIDNQEAAQLRETQRKVREKIEGFIERHGQMPKALKPIYLRLVRGLSEAHASSVWSATKNEGYGRSINIYEYFGVYARQDARSRTLPSMSGFDELLEELLTHPDMKRSDMRRSRKFVAEVMEAAKQKHLEFLKQTQTVGEATLQPLLESEHKFWQDCINQRGLGGGYRNRVTAIVEKWFDDHPEVTRKLERRIQDTWNEIFIGWLRSYVNADGAPGV